jgi:pimeloyl-ACP methyl ester carboxylesterase
MARDVVVIFVHGIGVESNRYDDPLRQGILKQLSSTHANHVEFHSVFWADAVRNRQRGFLNSASNAPGFNAHALHEFVIERLGDASAYQKTSHRVESTYFAIQAKMRQTILAARRGPNDHRPLIFVGHSLGCHIASSYAWDLHKLKHQLATSEPNAWDTNTADWAECVRHASPLERLDTWAGFITLGSNQPLFTFQLDKDQIFPITRTNLPGGMPAFPGVTLDPTLTAIARWDNLFSKNDPLGYPLRPLNDHYRNEPRLRDHAVTSEGWLRSRVPFGWYRQLISERAHEGYWTNATVATHAAQLITDLITAPVSAQPSPDPVRASAQPWSIFPHLSQ